MTWAQRLKRWLIITMHQHRMSRPYDFRCWSVVVEMESQLAPLIRPCPLTSLPCGASLHWVFLALGSSLNRRSMITQWGTKEHCIN